MLNNDTLDGGESQSRWTHSIAQSIVQAARRPDPASDLHEQLPGGRAPDRMETGTHTQVHTTSGCTGGAAGEAPAMWEAAVEAAVEAAQATAYARWTWRQRR